MGPIGAFVASCLTAVVAFTGIVLSNRAALRRQRIDLQSAAEVSKIERDQALRERIYLEMLNDIGIQLGTLFELWNVQKATPESNIDFSKATGSMYRTYLVASSKTTQALIGLNEAAVRASTKVLPLRVRYMAVVASRDRMENMLERIRQERERLDSELKTERPSDARRIEVDVRRQKLDQMEQTLLERLGDSVEHTTSSALNILMIGVRTRNGVERKVFELVAAIREELGLPVIGEETLRLLSAAAEDGLKATEEAMSDLRAAIPSLLQSAGRVMPKSAEPT